MRRFRVATRALAAAAFVALLARGASAAGGSPGKEAATATAKPDAAPKPEGSKADGAGAAKPAAPSSTKAVEASASSAPSAKKAPAPKPAQAAPARPRAETEKAPAKPVKKAAAKPKKSPPKKPVARRTGPAGQPDEAVRRIIAGTTSLPTGGRTTESPELRAMRELDLALFPSPAPNAGPAWPAGTFLLDHEAPVVHASGLPPSPDLPTPPAEKPRDLSWLRQLDMPDIPVRWDARVVRYLEFYKNNPRGRSMVASWIRKSGRYGAAIRRILREHGLPEDVLWLSLVESGFDPTVQSPAGAAGLWQFMPEGARIYGLTVDRWTDERLDPERSTIAAARYLADLRQRFGGWELAFAAYNMGYGGLLASIRKYNTNDFWELSRIEAGVPLETALYVPKIVALAIVARNRAVFGCDTIELDSPVPFDRIAVGPGVSLETIASAAGVPTSAIEELNPQFLAARTPPLGRGASPPDAKAGGAGASAGATDGTPWEVRVPAGTGPKAARALERLVHRGERLARYVVRWGETIDDIAARTRTKRSHIVSLNALRRDEVPRPGTVLLVPARAADAADATTTSARAEAPVVVVPDQTFSYRDRARVFYRVVPGDTLRDLANVFSVSADELCRWNALDPGATLQEGMTLQVFPPPSADLRNVVVLAEKQARILRVGTPEFFAHFEAQKGRKRIEVVAREGDTWRSIGKRYGLSAGMLERINRKSRTTPVRPGDKLVVYVPLDEADAAPDEERADERPEVAVASAEGSVGTGSGPEGADGDGDDAKDEESATPEEGEAKEGATRPAVLEREPSPSPDAKKND